MANWAIPQLSDLKVDVLDQLKLRDVDSYTMAESPVNPPTGAKRWNTSLNKFESWNGSAWVTMVVSIAGGGTGATDINGFLGNFGLGSMALQNNNAVNITGGSITNLSNLTTNTFYAQVIVAGSGGIPHTNSAGYLPQASIEDNQTICNTNQQETISSPWFFAGGAQFNAGAHVSFLGSVSFVNGSIVEEALANGTLLARNAGNETITGSWTFNAGTSFRGSWINIIGGPYQYVSLNREPLGTTNENSAMLIQEGSFLDLRFYNDVGNDIRYPMRIQRSGFSTEDIIFRARTVTIKRRENTSDPATLRLYGETYSGGGGSQISFLQDGAVTASIISGSASVGLGISGGTNGIALGNAGEYRFTNAYELHIGYNSNSMMARLRINSLPSAECPMTIQAGEPGVHGGYGIIAMNYYGIHGGASGRQNNAIGASYIRMQQNAIEIQTIDAGGGHFNMMNMNPTRIALTPPLNLKNGSTSSAAVQFVDSTNSGMYFNPAGTATCELGAQFNQNNRSIVRCHCNTASGLVDFIVGNNFPLMLETSNVHVGRDGYSTNMIHYGHAYPRSHGAYNSGGGSTAWNAVYSTNPLQMVSDIRFKDNHGPLTNVLDIVDSIHPFIASFKNELRPKENDIERHWDKKFPSFSAQEIKAKIDDVFGTRIVDDDFEWLNMADARLMPIMWQAIRELYARVKGLEN